MVSIRLLNFLICSSDLITLCLFTDPVIFFPPIPPVGELIKESIIIKTFLFLDW